MLLQELCTKQEISFEPMSDLKIWTRLKLFLFLFFSFFGAGAGGGGAKADAAICPWVGLTNSKQEMMTSMEADKSVLETEHGLQGDVFS